jgi:CO/xanthine dehydrogenase FAD-binding subunit
VPVPVSTRAATARPTSLPDVFDALDEFPDAHLLAGGTDFMVEVNFGHRRPRSVVALRRVAELDGYDIGDDEVVIGAGTTWSVIEHELADVLPALAAAARTVGSPQMRNAGTIGGNLGTASPAGDGLPVLAAHEASVVLASRTGTRELPVAEFVTGVKRTALAPGEVITQVRVPRVDGPQHFLKVGTRNAMVISIVCGALAIDRANRSVRLGLGSVSPRPLRATAAEEFIAAQIDWSTMTAAPEAVRHFGELAADAASPISDHRSTSAYRSHAVSVIARRALERSLA